MRQVLTMPKPRKHRSARSAPTGGGSPIDLARSLAASLILVVVAPGIALFGCFIFVFWGFSIGGAAPELEAVYRLEDTFNLIGAGAVATAWALAMLDLRGLRRTRLLACVVLTLLCVVGGLAATYGLRHSPAQLDPDGGHRAGEVRDGRVYWQPLAFGAGMCALAVAIAPNRYRRKSASSAPVAGS